VRQHRHEEIAHLVLSVDADLPATPDESPKTGLTAEGVLQLVKEAGVEARREQRSIILGSGETTVSLVRWEAADKPQQGLPNQQTLERLVCAALLAAYPDRGGPVDAWLSSRPSPSDPGPKEHAWSYMAGWYADRGCQDVYSALWEDGKIAAGLETRLRASGAWQVAEALAE